MMPKKTARSLDTFNPLFNNSFLYLIHRASRKSTRLELVFLTPAKNLAITTRTKYLLKMIFPTMPDLKFGQEYFSWANKGYIWLKIF